MQWRLHTDPTIQLSIRSVAGKNIRYGGRSDLIEVTLKNAGRDTVILCLPGDGSFWGWRTPLMDWDVGETGGAALKRVPVAVCGNINPLGWNEVFRLPPGKERKFSVAFPYYYPYKESQRYRLRLSYENRPDIVWGIGGMGTGTHDPDALRLLRASTP